MQGKIKRVAWFLLRLGVAAGLIAYVVSQINLRDAVRPAQGERPLPVVRETAEGVVVRTQPTSESPQGGERLIPLDAFGPDGAVRLQGILSMIRGLAQNWGWSLAAVLAMLAQAPVGAIRWQLLLSVQGIRITFLESLRLTYVGWFFSNWMPGATGGDLIKAYYIAKQTHQKAEAVTVVFLDRLIGLIAMCMLGAAAVAVSLHDERVRIAQVVVGAFLIVVVAGITVFYSRRLRRLLWVDRLLEKLPLRATVARVDKALFIYRFHKTKILVAMGLSWIAQIFSVMAVWWGAVAVGSRASWDHYFLNMPVIWIGWSLIPVPGGFGVAETLTQALFGPQVLGGGDPMSVADAATMALAIILAYRLTSMFSSLPGGVLYLMQRTSVSPTHMRDEMEAQEADA